MRPSYMLIKLYRLFITITATVNGRAEYMTAEAIIITLVINNHVNEDLNKPAEAWEKV